MDVFLQRLEALEKSCDGGSNLVEQVAQLERQVDQFLHSSGASGLDFTRLKQLLDATDATILASRRQVVNARAIEALQQTQGGCVDPSMSADPPKLEVWQVDEIKRQADKLVHEFDETTIRSVHAARIYLDRFQH